MKGKKKVEPVHAVRLSNLERMIASQPSKAAQSAFLKRNKLQGNNIWQMRQPPGSAHWRPIGYEKARAIEKNEKLEEMALDAPALGEVSPAVAQSRSKNNVLALRLAMQSFGTVLHSSRPDIAEVVARDIVASAGVEFSQQAFLNTLVSLLLGVEQMSAEDLKELLQQRASSKPRRASAVKA